jgi:hypothetical protein
MEHEMDQHPEADSHFVKRVVLPSGKTIEVVYFKDSELPESQVQSQPHPAAEPHQDLHICRECESQLVYPVSWEESGPENWSVLLHCPNCDLHREGVFSQYTVECFDEQLDRGADALARDYKRLMRANMAEEIELFAGALASDALLPEDF